MTSKILDWLSLYLPDFWGSQVIYFAAVLALELVLTYIVLKIIFTIIKRIAAKILIKGKDKARIRTIEVIINNSCRYGLWAGMALSFIYYIGLSGIVATFLAAAGIGTFIFGLASQDVLRDIISGISILGEERFRIGDFIETAGLKGTVENIKLRSTLLRTESGELVIIPNGRIFEIKNYSMTSAVQNTNKDK